MKLCCIMLTTPFPAEKNDSPVMAIRTVAKSVTHSMMWAMNPIKHDRQAANHLNLEFSSCACLAIHSDSRRMILEIVRIRLLKTRDPKDEVSANLKQRSYKEQLPVKGRAYPNDFMIDMLPRLASSAKYH